MRKNLLNKIFPTLVRYRIIRVRRRRKSVLRGKSAHYKKNKEIARVVVQQKLIQFNQYYGFKYERVAIRNQRSRWGSCSKKGNLNFHYRIAFLPEKFLDYVVVHELCHLKEFNHSKNFWALVEKTIPDHVVVRRELHSHQLS